MSATVELYNVNEGKLVDYELSVDSAGDILATYNDDFLKFPSGLTKKQLLSAFTAHNKENDGKIALTEEEIEEEENRVVKTQELIDSLEN